MSLLQIGLLESLFNGTSLLSEIPSGMLADRFTYKTNLYLSRVSAIISALFMLFGNGNFWLYAIGMVISAWSYNFDSGTSAAMLFESAKEAGLEDKYLKYTSIISGFSEATRSFGMVVAGFLVHGFLSVTYVIQIGLSLLVLLIIVFMKEPQVKLEGKDVMTLKEIIKTLRIQFRTNPNLLRWLIVNQTMLTFITMFYFYYQNEISKLSSWEISGMMLLSSGVNIISVWFASWLGKRWTSKQLFKGIVPIVALLFLLAITQHPAVYALIFLLSDGLVAMFLPVFSNDFQKELKSSVRATMLSINAMLGSLSMVFIFPLMGFAIDSFGFSISFVGLGLFLLISHFILFNIKAYR